MKKIYKKRMNNDGAIGITSIIVILIISLIVWQFAIPLIDDSISVPSDLFNYVDVPDDDIYAKAYYKDTLTNVKQEIKTGYRSIVMEQGHNYQLIIETNAPYKIINEPYEMVVSMEFYNDTTLAWEFIWGENSGMPLEALWTNSFVFPLSMNTHFNFHIYFELYSPNGEMKMDSPYPFLFVEQF